MNEIGNTTNFDGWTYAWQAGRQLASAIKPGVAEATFAYDAGGMRTQKTVDGVTTEYTYHGSMLMHLKKGNNNLHFFYNAQSRPAFVSFNGTRYTYLHNLQGDIIGIVDDSGALVVEYGYDAWGKPFTPTGTLTTTLGVLNPFRYRGYIWDDETGLYYLKSRYYNPEWGRFINADSLGGETGKLLSHNVFTYCANNPVNAKDPSGHEEMLYNAFMTAVNSSWGQSVMSWLEYNAGQVSSWLASSGLSADTIAATAAAVADAFSYSGSDEAEDAKAAELTQRDSLPKNYRIAMVTGKGIGGVEAISDRINILDAGLCYYGLRKMLATDAHIGIAAKTRADANALVLFATGVPDNMVKFTAHGNGNLHTQIAKGPARDVHIWVIPQFYM